MTPTLDRIIEALATFGQAAAVLGLLMLVAGLGLPASMFAVTVEDMADDGDAELDDGLFGERADND